MKYILIILFIALRMAVGLGQEAITISKFLSLAKQQESVYFQEKKIEYLNTLSFDLPFIEKLEFRTETNDFDLRKQEYLLRVSPNSFRNIKTNRQYQQTVKNMTEMELDEAWGRALKDRYHLLVDYIYSKEILTFRIKQKILLNDKVTLLKRSSSLPGFDVLDLIDAEDDAQDNMRELLDTENQISTLERIFQKMNNSNISIDSASLISIEQVSMALSDLQPSETINHSQLNVLSAEMYKNMLEYEWEAAKTKFSLGYIQAKYGYSPGDPFRKSFSIGVGFDIPLRNSGRLELNELEITILESESEYQNLKNELAKKSFTIYQKIFNVIAKYNLVKEQLDESQAEYAFNEYSKMTETSPMALLKLRENTIEKELLLLQLEEEIIFLFIEYLDCSGFISQKPLKNYLSKEFDTF